MMVITVCCISKCMGIVGVSNPVGGTCIHYHNRGVNVPLKQHRESFIVYISVDVYMKMKWGITPRI